MSSKLFLLVHEAQVQDRELHFLNITKRRSYSTQSNNSKLHPHAAVAFILPPVEWVSPSYPPNLSDLLMLTFHILGDGICLMISFFVLIQVLVSSHSEEKSRVLEG